MIAAPVLRQIQMDNLSLCEYSMGNFPTFDDIKRRLMLNERRQNHNLPDHFYISAGDFTLGSINNLPELITVGLPSLASEFLEITSNRVFVKAKALSQWQNLLTFCSPLLCMASLLWERKFDQGQRDPLELVLFAEKYINENCRFSSILSPNIPPLERLMEESGFSDLHVHLNGSTETDEVWQQFLKNPIQAFNAVHDSFYSTDQVKREKIREQFEQEAHLLNPNGFYQRLRTAQRIRRRLVDWLFNGKYTPELNVLKNYGIPDYEIIKSGSWTDYMWPFSDRHPLRFLLRDAGRLYTDDKDLCLEALLYILVFDEICDGRDETLATMFHCYILILGSINRFLVQQITQVGFDQFQKITLNGLRNDAERHYDRRFYQLHGNKLNKLRILEGRFSPQDTSKDNFLLLNRIVSGYGKFTSFCNKEGKRPFELKLVGHFIKQRDIDNLPDDSSIKIRHGHLRDKLWTKANGLTTMLSQKHFHKYFVGIDAASNELDTPPEVFAPIYRFLRQKGIKNFTYHVGEDFHHLVGGLRAIYEAIYFLGLEKNDRIGHGTAAGIDPELWINNLEDGLYISKGEWLDDLTFAHCLLSENTSFHFPNLLRAIASEIKVLSREIYEKDFSLFALNNAWLARKYDPRLLLFEKEGSSVWPKYTKEERSRVSELNYDAETLELIRLYHTSKYRIRYAQKKKIGALDVFKNPKRLIQLQQLLINEIRTKGIILEALPTSNVRISFYKNYDEYHLWRWFSTDKLKKRANNHRWRWLNLNISRILDKYPAVVIGTDDPGIFATNIFNEYCHIYHYLINIAGLSEHAAIGIIEEVIENSNNYRFSNF